MLRIVFIAVGSPMVYLLSKVLDLGPRPITIVDSRREAHTASLVILSVFTTSSVWNVFGTAALPTEPQSDATYVLLTAFFCALFLLPLVIAMRTTSQNLESIGITGKDIWRMLSLGLLLSLGLFMATGFYALF